MPIRYVPYPAVKQLLEIICDFGIKLEIPCQPVEGGGADMLLKWSTAIILAYKD